MLICPILNSECLKERCVAFYIENTKIDGFMEESIEKLEHEVCSARARNVLRTFASKYEIKTIGQFEEIGLSKLLGIKNCGDKTYSDIRDAYYSLRECYLDENEKYICKALNCEIDIESFND